MRRIVFASGKGGTGKTTLAAVCAHLAAAEGPLVLADCDVEAANLPIALRASAIARKPFAGASVARIDPARCRGCGACRRACRFGAIGPAEDFEASRVFRIDAWACEGCGACMPTCADRAITAHAATAGEVVSAESVAGPMVFGRLGPGEDLSGKLVTEVRRQASVLADSAGARLMLLDGPPGVGCPAIAAVADTDLMVAVTEPTIAGEHDLARLVTLARRLGVPVAIVLNKADLSGPGAARIRAYASGQRLPLIGEIPFDPGLASLLERSAAGDRAWWDRGPGVEAGRGVWQRIAAWPSG